MILFKKDKFDFPNVKKNRFYIGILVGLLTGVFFYLFFYLSREAIRLVFSSTEYYDLWILTPKETWFYNLVFAFISMIFGEAACLKIWYERINSGYNAYFDYRRKTIVNEIFVLNSNFLNVFAKVAAIYGIWIGETFGYLEFSFYPDFNYVWILVIIVLHLEQWKTINRIFKRKSLKGFLLFTANIIVISFLLSFYNPIDIPAVNNSQTSKSIDFNYQIERPISAYAKNNYFFHYYVDLYFVHPKDEMYPENNTPTLILDNEVIALENLCNKINTAHYSYDPLYKYKITIHIHCDKHLSMKYLKLLKAELSKCGVDNISYAVMPPDYPFPSRFCRYHGIKAKLPDYSSYSSPEELDLDYFLGQDIIQIEVLDSNNILINNALVTRAEFAETLMKIMNSTSFRQIQLFVNDIVDYQTYIIIRDYVNYTVLYWLDMKTNAIFEKNYNDLEPEEMNLFNQDYYFTIIELTNMLKKKINFSLLHRH